MRSDEASYLRNVRDRLLVFTRSNRFSDEARADLSDASARLDRLLANEPIEALARSEKPGAQRVLANWM